MLSRLRQRRLFVLVAAVVVLCGAATIGSGSPERLPNVALGSVALLHLERLAVLFAASLFFLVVLARAWGGELPSEVRGVQYTPAATTEAIRETAAAALDDLAQAQLELRERVDVLEERV